MRYLSQDSCISGMGRNVFRKVLKAMPRVSFYRDYKCRMISQGGRSAKRSGPQNRCHWDRIDMSAYSWKTTHTLPQHTVKHPFPSPITRSPWFCKCWPEQVSASALESPSLLLPAGDRGGELSFCGAEDICSVEAGLRSSPGPIRVVDYISQNPHFGYNCPDSAEPAVFSYKVSCWRFLI